MTTNIGRAFAPALAAASFIAAMGLATVPAPGHATQRSSHSASLVTPLTQPREAIVGGVLWKCDGESCSAPASGSRPMLVCERVAKAFGPIASFTSSGGELSPEDLARCNGGK